MISKTTLALALTLFSAAPAYANSTAALSNGLAGHSKTSTRAVAISTAVSVGAAGSVVAAPLLSVGTAAGKSLSTRSIEIGAKGLMPNQPLKITDQTIVSKQPNKTIPQKSPADAMK